MTSALLSDLIVVRFMSMVLRTLLRGKDDVDREADWKSSK